MRCIKPGAVFLAFLVLCSIAAFAQVPQVKAVSLTRSRVFTCDPYTVGHYDIDSNYTAVWVDEWGDYPLQDIIAVGQKRDIIPDPDEFWIYRFTGLYFDASIIPDGASITAAKISLFPTEESSGSYILVVQSGANYDRPLYPGDYSDFNKEYYEGNGGQYSWSHPGPGTRFNITLNADGRSWISLNGMTKFCLRSANDINGNTPSGIERTYFYGYSNPYGQEYRPLLYVTYTINGFRYYLHGAYNEQGTREGAINCTFYRQTEDAVNFELDGTYTTTSEVCGSLFEFDLGLNESRIYYLRPDLSQEWIYVFKPSSPYYVYYFTLIDLVGINNGFLETVINVNGTDRVVERWRTDILNEIPFMLSWGRTYTLRLICDEGTYVFGSYVAGAQSEYTVVVTHDMFPDDAINTRNITVSAGRPSANHVQVNYTDAGSKTLWVYVAIYELTGSSACYETNNTGQSQQINWYGAGNSTDYRVFVKIKHETLGYLQWGFGIPAPYTSTNPWSGLRALGRFPFDVTQLIGILIVLLVFGAFNQMSASAAIISGLLATAILVLIGWLAISWGWVSLCFGIGIVAILAMEKRKTERGLA